MSPRRLHQISYFEVPGVNFEVLPRAKNSKLCQDITYIHKTIPNDARSTKKPDINDFGCTQGHSAGRIKLAIVGPQGYFTSFLSTFETCFMKNRATLLTFVSSYWIYDTYRTFFQKTFFTDLRALRVAGQNNARIFQIFDISKAIISRGQQHYSLFFAFLDRFHVQELVLVKKT